MEVSSACNTQVLPPDRPSARMESGAVILGAECHHQRVATLSSSGSLRVGDLSPSPLPQLYESALAENQKLKTKLQEAQLELTDVKAKLEKMAQVRQGDGRAVGRTALARA